MNGADIKNAIDKLVPDKEMEGRISEKILKKQHNEFPFKQIASIAASLVIVISLGILGNNFLTGTQKSTSSSNSNNLNGSSNSNGSTAGSSSFGSADGIFIPKFELPKNSNSSNGSIANIRFIEYEGRVYTETGTNISLERAEELLDKKLSGNEIVNNQSKQVVNSGFVSNVDTTGVYSVKGYDKSFRVMTYGKINGNISTEFFECLNGITVKNGNDFFSKLKIENNIRTVKYESYESWNNKKQEYKEVTNLKVLNNFVSEFKNTVPYTSKSVSHLLDENRDNQKLVYIILNDGSEVQLILYKNDYIYYRWSHVYFKMDSKVFGEMWNELK
jgi:hypothetical protein